MFPQRSERTKQTPSSASADAAEAAAHRKPAAPFDPGGKRFPGFLSAGPPCAARVHHADPGLFRGAFAQRVCGSFPDFAAQCGGEKLSGAEKDSV